MSDYLFHFIIALISSTLFALILSKSNKKRILAFFIVPTIFYSLFYDFNQTLFFDGIFTIISVYCGAIFSLFLFLFAISYEKVDFEFKKINLSVFKIISLFLLQYFAIVYSQIVPWALQTFPLSNVEAVLFTLFVGVNEGAEEFVLTSFIKKVLHPATKIFVVFLCLQVFFIFVLFKEKLLIKFNLFKINYFICGYNIKECFVRISKLVFIFTLIYGLIQTLVLPSIMASSPFKALFQHPVNSELYNKHYVKPVSKNIISNDSPMNLIVIFLESMETNFSKYTPEIVDLQKEHLNFLPGGSNVAGSSWTIAAITSKLCGIPLNMPMGINEYLGKLPTYLPGAVCLMDILNEKDYSQVYVQGSSGDFTQKRTFWTVHGNVTVHDIEYFKMQKKIPENYNVFWGFEDRKLYHFAKDELQNLSSQNKPFALYMLTVDTHQPEGYIDDSCAQKFKNTKEPFLKALNCASTMLNEFLNWAKKEPWYSNTVISVMGDHTMQMLSPIAHVNPNDSLFWVNFLINSKKTSYKKREYSSLDMFPTLLEAMGYEIENHSAGLGRSLFSDSLNMLELYGIKTLDSLLRERSFQYDEFLFTKQTK